MKNKILPVVVCPECHGRLYYGKSFLQCGKCEKHFHQKDNLVSFLPKMDRFYEGKYVETRDFETMMPAILGRFRHISYRIFVEINIVTRAERFFRHRLRGKKI